MPGVTLELTQRDDALALEPVQQARSPTRSRVPSRPPSISASPPLSPTGSKPRPFSELRASCRVRTTTLYERLAAMTAAGLVVKSA